MQTALNRGQVFQCNVAVVAEGHEELAAQLSTPIEVQFAVWSNLQNQRSIKKESTQ